MSRTPARTLAKTLVCKQCGTKATIQRRVRHDRPAGHIKPLWCFVCKARTEHVEQAA